MKVQIGNAAIEIDGQGLGVPVAEIKRVKGLFVKMFGVQPRIRMSGRFPQGAIKPGSHADKNVDIWDLTRGSGSGYYPVIHVGPEYVAVQPYTGLNDNRSVQLSPDRGTTVKVRFLLPSE